MMLMDNRPIGVFDSGLGGLSTVRAMKKLLPGEDIIYFGDTGRVPYGTRSNETVETYAAQDIKFLQSFSCKMIVAACGTVSTAAANVLHSTKEPSTGIAKPSAKAAVNATKNKNIGVMGTSATVNSGAFDKEIAALLPEAKVTSVSCPLLVSLVESNWIDIDDEVTNAAVKRYITPILNSGADTIILGCTHFPILAPIIQKIAGDGVTLIDSGLEEARYVGEVLREKGMQNDAAHHGTQRFFVSDKTQNFVDVARVLLGEDISDKCEFVDIFKVI
ncbi:MAG: glutamate racemase [Ruminococcaceae bacterium]|nr:glutamate racemase [Oscillospiraceae bacterium]